MSGVIRGKYTSGTTHTTKSVAVGANGEILVSGYGGTEDSAVGGGGTVVAGEARSSAKTAVDNGDAVILAANLSGEIVAAGYDWTNGLIKVAEQDPITDHYDPNVQVADVTNGTDGTYLYYIGMNGYQALELQLILDGGSGSVTVTIEATGRGDGTAAASCEYEDVSSTLYGAANWTADAILDDDGRIAGQYVYIKVKVVAATGGANDADWEIFGKRLN